MFSDQGVSGIIEENGAATPFTSTDKNHGVATTPSPSFSAGGALCARMGPSLPPSYLLSGGTASPVHSGKPPLYSAVLKCARQDYWPSRLLLRDTAISSRESQHRLAHKSGCLSWRTAC